MITSKITPEIAVTLVVLLAFTLSVVLAILRLRSTREVVVIHLAAYTALGGVASLFHLVALLQVTPLAIIGYHLAFELTLLLMILTYGALTLTFLEKEQTKLFGYWAGAGLIFLLWSILAFNLLGWGDAAGLAVGLTAPQLAQAVAGVGWLAALITTLAILTLDFRQHHPTQYLNRLRYWLIATALLGVSGLTFFVSPMIFNLAGTLLMMIGSMLASYIILSYHTPDLKLLIGRAMRYLSVTGVLFLIFLSSLVAMIFITSYNILSPANAFFWSIVLAVLLANFFPVLLDLLNRISTRIIFGKERRDQKMVIQHYSQRISSALDMQRLGDTAINLMIETLGVEQGIVFVSDRGREGDMTMRPISSVGKDEIQTQTLATDSPFVDYFRQGKKQLNQYDLDRLPEFRGMRPEERAWLQSLRMELYVPILRQLELVGLLAFGPRPHGASYYHEDLDLMITLADQIALAIDSARLFEQLAIINQEVGQLTTQLAGLDQTKSDFLSIASHELRTPLTHIHGYSRMLLDLTEEELQNPTYVKKMIEGVVKGSDRMKDMIDVMFNVTEVDVGEINLFLGPVSLEDVLGQATRNLLPAMDERRIAFDKSGFKDLPTIEADGTRLVQAFENLISNAIKYTPDGGMIKVEGRPIVEDGIGSAVEIIVSDTGIGIAPEHHQRIFEKFFRVDDLDHHSTSKTKFKGAGPGLGLTLVKGTAEAHGGRVWVESPGHDEEKYPGSKFHFVIPLHPVADDKKEEEAIKQSQIETRHWRRKDLEKHLAEMEQEAKGTAVKG
jgi:signal transduction histidine kinase